MKFLFPYKLETQHEDSCNPAREAKDTAIIILKG